MSTRDRVVRVAVLPVFLMAFCPHVLAQTGGRPDATPPQAVVDLHDLGGVWNGGLRVNTVAPMLPAAQAKFDENRSELAAGHSITKNPAFSCHPPGIPAAYNNGLYPIEIVQTPKRMFVFFESAHHWRTIWMDGRDMPKDADPLWMGYSVGHWQGNDLVVETANFNDVTWLDAAGHPHSAALRVTERFRRVDRETLQIDLTVNDAMFYTAPWTMTASYALRPTWELGEQFCVPEDQTKFQDVILGPNAKPK